MADDMFLFHSRPLPKNLTKAVMEFLKGQPYKIEDIAEKERSLGEAGVRLSIKTNELGTTIQNDINKFLIGITDGAAGYKSHKLDAAYQAGWKNGKLRQNVSNLVCI